MSKEQIVIGGSVGGGHCRVVKLGRRIGRHWGGVYDRFRHAIS